MPSSSKTILSLPAEIRLQCLSYLPSWDFASYAQICRLLSNDLDPELCRSLDLSLTIDPVDISSVKVTLDKDGEGESRKFALGDLLLPEHPFMNAPFDEFRSINIIILAPNRSDPGQMVSAFNHLNGVLNMISPRWKDERPPSGLQDIVAPPGCRTIRLPDTNISFRNNPHAYGTWPCSATGFFKTPCRDLGIPASWEKEFDWLDVDVLLTTLERLRNCKSCTITGTESVSHDENLENSVRRLNDLATNQTPYGLYGLYNVDTDPIPDSLDTDSRIQSEIDGYSVFYHYHLPTMRGPTAAKLRQRHYSGGYKVRSRLFQEAFYGRPHPNSQMKYSVDLCEWGLDCAFGGGRYNQEIWEDNPDIEAHIERVNLARHMSGTGVMRIGNWVLKPDSL